MKFTKHLSDWNAKDLLKDIQGINPDFYPKPVIQRPSERPGVKMDWLERSDDYLTKDRFITLYDKCGGILHARNPFAPEQDYPMLEQAAPNWHLLILNLLNAHTIRLVGQTDIWLMQMASDSESPTYTLFGRTRLPN